MSPPSSSRDQAPVAVIGLACRMPHAGDPRAFWRNMISDEHQITEIPVDRFDWRAYYGDPQKETNRTISKWGGFLDRIDRFDAAFFGISPREADLMDPQQRIMLELTWHCLEDGGYAAGELAGSQTGVFIGVCNYDYKELQEQYLSQVSGHGQTGTWVTNITNRISYWFNFHGPSIPIDTACSSSLVAIHQAMQGLRRGECDLALAGGVSLICSPRRYIGFSQLGMLSPTGRCRTFDANADGYVRGEGAGIILLKNLDRAVEDGDHIYGVILGSAVNHGGKARTLTSPNAYAQSQVVMDAYLDAGVSPDTVSFIECHGTGTPLGDPIEINGLKRAFSRLRKHFGVPAPAGPYIGLGTVKTRIGHLESSAGIAGVLNVLLALGHRTLPGLYGHENLNPRIQLGKSPFYLLETSRPWTPLSDREGRPVPRRAGISSFGAGGTNAHVVLEEAPPLLAAPTDEPERPFLVCLSARGDAALRELARQYAACLLENPDLSLPDIGFTSTVGRSHLDRRLAAVVNSPAELAKRFAAYGSGADPSGLRSGRAGGEAPLPPVFLFTGQGSQYVGMGRQLYASQPVFHNALDRCNDILRSLLKRPVLDVLYGIPDGALDETAFTQPALFALEYSLSELWQSWGVKPGAVIGHSVGEYVAACIAGVFSLEDGLTLIAARGRLMQALPRDGTMAAVFADEDRVVSALDPHAAEVSIAAVNGPGQVVISGKQEAIRSVCADLESNGVTSRQLTVSHAFHSPLMEPMLDEFEAVAREVTYSEPNVPVVSNVTGRFATEEIARADYWRRHVRAAVRFQDGLTALYESGHARFLELGPKPTLIGMGRRFLPREGVEWLASLRSEGTDWKQMLDALAALWSVGDPIEWRAVHKGAVGRRVPLPVYPFAGKRYWINLEGLGIPALNPSAGSGGFAHPLLGPHRDIAGRPGHRVHESLQSTTASPPYLLDHRVFDAPVFPAAGFLEMMLAACPTAVAGGKTAIGCAVLDAEIRQALPLEDEPRVMQCIATQDGVGRHTVQVFSRPQRADEAEDDAIRSEPDWVLHATARLVERSPQVARAAVDREDLLAETVAALEREAFYKSCRARGLDYGPCFQAVERVWRGNGIAVGSVRLPNGVAGDGFLLHPVLLDGCFQVLLAALPSEPHATYLPVGIERMNILGPAKSELWCEARVRDPVGAHDAPLHADVRLFDETGSVVAEVHGLALRRSTRDALFPKRREPWRDWLYEVEWRKESAGGRSSIPEFLPAPSELHDYLCASRLAQWEQQLAHQEGDSHRLGLRDRLESLSLAYIIAALRTIGWEFQPDECVAVDEQIARFGIADSQQRLFGRLIEVLEEEAILRRAGEDWEVVNTPPTIDPLDVISEIQAAYPESGPELSLLCVTGPRLAGILRGEVDPLQLMFPEGDLQAARHLYEEARELVAMNTLVADAVTRALESLPTDRTVRVLELGAGTGATTASILPHVPPDRSEYVFTDITPMFTHKAEQKFADYGFLQYRTLDIEMPPEPQGFEVHSFHIVLAANVVHATRDLGETVRNARQLLAPGGILILLEGTARRRWVDLTFGLLEGWWRFADRRLRPDYPLIDGQQWRRLLGKNGFDAVDTVELPGSPDVRIYPQSVVIARAGLEPDAAQHSWLICGDRGGLGIALADRLRGRGDRCVLAQAGEGFETISANEFSVNPADLAQVAELLKTVDTSIRSGFDGVVHLWSLDAPGGDDLTAAALEEASRVGCGSALALVQALVRAGGETPRLWLVTRDAVRADDTDPVSGVAQSSLWGMAKAIELEHPEFHCVRIDLSGAKVDETMDALVGELRQAQAGREEYVALRRHGRYAGRLIRIPQRGGAADQRETPPGRPYRLASDAPGAVDALRWAPAERSPPGPGEVEVLVRAAGLNFIDVMDALGLLPFARDGLGIECAGEVTAVGEGVTSLRPGDEVAGIAEGAFGRYAVTHAALMVRKPANLSFEEAASIPANFLTADYALREVAGVTEGQRVLVHAAAGGTGLAAVQIAQRAGAEVWGTASPGKWALLRMQGVLEIMNSRTLEFTDDIMTRTNGHGIDIVLNSLAGEFIPRSLSALKPDGCFIEIGKTGVWSPKQAAEVRPDVHYALVDLFAMCRREPEKIQGMLQRLMERFATGELRPVPRTVYALGDVLQAFRTMQQGRHVGKLVVSMPGPTGEPSELFRPDATYLIVGGLGGLGPLVAKWMMDRGARHFALMGRGGMHDDARKPLRELEEAGADIRVFRADVSRAEQVSTVLADIEQSMPPLRGIIHSAGVLDDGILIQQTWDRFAGVMAPKVTGAWHLHVLTRELPLDFFVLFSSVASLLGSKGQANHSAANAFLDALASFRRARGLPGLSINWGAWSGIGAAARRDREESWTLIGMDWIPPHEGIAALKGVFSHPRAQVGVVPITDWGEYLAQRSDSTLFRDLQPVPPMETATGATDVVRALEETPADERRGLAVAYVRDEVRGLLGFDASVVIDSRAGFFDIGLDSLTSVELRNRLQTTFRCTLPPTLSMDHPNIEALADHLLGSVLFPAKDAVDSRGQELDDLSDIELADLLDRELTDLNPTDRSA